MVAWCHWCVSFLWVGEWDKSDIMCPLVGCSIGRRMGRERCSPSVLMWQNVNPRHTNIHTQTHTLALAAPLSRARIMCQEICKLRQKVSHKRTYHPLIWPSGLPSNLPHFLLFALCTLLVLSLLDLQLHSSSPKPSRLPPWGFSCFLARSILSYLLLTLIFPLLYLFTCPAPSFVPHASLSFLNTLIFSHPPFLHFRTWQSYHYPATYLLAACYFPFALRGPGAKSLPRILDPSHRIYPGVAWRVWSTPAAPSFFSCVFPSLPLFLPLSLLSHSVFLSIGFFSFHGRLCKYRPFFSKSCLPIIRWMAPFSECYTHAHTRAECITHSIRNTRTHAISHKHSHWLAHTRVQTHARAQRESPPLQHGCYILSSERFKL